MSYGENLYRAENIIGYTGDPQNNPTVYFEIKNRKGVSTWGRITQDHTLESNIGRDKVRTSSKYVIGNQKINGVWHGVEYKGSEFLHQSRGQFIRLNDQNENLRDTLANAIDLFPKIKTDYLDIFIRNGVAEMNENTQNLEQKANYLSDLDEGINTVKRDVINIEGKINEAETEVARLKKDVNLMNTALKAKPRPSKLERKQINGNIVQIKADIRFYQKEIKTAKAMVRENNTKIKKAESKLKTQRTKLEKAFKKQSAQKAKAAKPKIGSNVFAKMSRAKPTPRQGVLPTNRVNRQTSAKTKRVNI
ncbi:hypothetical protein [Aquimarina pacifica]|uniref:hypothetical protein n=1 Tax=Aquimarina pacifica TaxID=1296415 RepID=UPI000471B669|nr:hypothetical protein [Aquimarina pacifica]